MSAECWPKTGFITGDMYCGKHGRAHAWPCDVVLPAQEVSA